MEKLLNKIDIAISAVIDASAVCDCTTGPGRKAREALVRRVKNLLGIRQRFIEAMDAEANARLDLNVDDVDVSYYNHAMPESLNVYEDA
jgi:hypothetical protein